MSITRPEPPEPLNKPSPAAPAEKAIPLNEDAPRDGSVAVLVAGVNYPRYKQNNQLPDKLAQTYLKFCNQYKDDLLKHGTVKRVLIFDFLTGQVLQYDKTTAKKGRPYLARKPWEKLQVSNYRHKKVVKEGDKIVSETLTFDKNMKENPLYYAGLHEVLKATGKKPGDDIAFSEWQKKVREHPNRKKKDAGIKENSLSVKDVYTAISAQPSGSVAELHFFGHAFAGSGIGKWKGGPIIVNVPSFTVNKAGLQIGKEFDKDCRRFDFDSHFDLETALGQGLSKFQRAFSKEAFSVVWGCDADQSILQTISDAIKIKASKKGGTTDYDAIIIQRMHDTYAKRLAEATNRDVFAAPPGTGSRHAGDPSDSSNDSHPWWHGLILMRIDLTIYSSVLRYYSKHLGVPMKKVGVNKGHPEFGRGFITYSP